MKRNLLMFAALVMGSTVLWIPGTARLYAANGHPAFAREHGQDDDDRGDRHDQGRHRGWRNKRFNDDGRRDAHEYYDHHRENWDRDRMAPEYEEHFREGYVIAPELRERCRPVPEDLAYRLGPPPRNCRYVYIGGHVCLIDRRYRVLDVIHLELNL